MTKEKHIKVHEILHKNLDELVADFIDCTGNLPSKTTIMELMMWSGKQLTEPDNRTTRYITKSASQKREIRR